MTAPIPNADFDEPWQAELFAITLALSDTGHFSWPDWTEAFGATLKSHGITKSLDGSADYYHAWLETLEHLLDKLDIASRAETISTRDLWQEAYLTTPHGKPVRISD
ncbi:MAG: nitrile hydratase accessory protein [Paracoccaceae bacterium]|nr:nitrile hydratase accessory protein [Paracoccaceae bacterium]